MDWEDLKQVFYNQERDYFKKLKEENELEKEKEFEQLNEIKKEIIYLQLLNNFSLLPRGSNIN